MNLTCSEMFDHARHQLRQLYNMMEQYLLMFSLTFAMISEMWKVPSEDRDNRYQSVAAYVYLNSLSLRETEKIKSKDFTFNCE